jgi:hypothetical protein
MARDTLVSWRTFALLLLAPPVGLAIVVLSPLLVGIVLAVYLHGRYRARGSTDRADRPETVQPSRGSSIREAYD